ncbi:unnamed protein product [Rotaria sp. Silwood2]|nr:unnamed protein product [Rotaria sp. Silwood2]CAF4203229.1 unnamed protein product [Rotaria sp. Silwood2]
MASQKSNTSTSNIENSQLNTRKNEIQNETNIQSICFVENFVLIWLDANVKESSDQFYDSVHQLQRFVNTIILVSDEIEYADLIHYTKNEKVFIIVSGTFGINLADIMEETPQIYSIYVYCDQREYHEKWATNFRKIKGVFTDMIPICEALRRDVRQANNDLISINILQSTKSPELDQLFICSLILKEVLINNEYNEETIKEFIKFCRVHYNNNSYQTKIIKNYEKNNKKLSPIQLYTSECFLYSMLNRALRLYDIKILTKINFFVENLHEQIKKIYSQSNDQQQITVYHEQTISNDQFLQLQKNLNSLISFNTFLMATMDKELSLKFLEQSQNNPDLIDVLFKIKIDRSISSYPFIILDEFDHYKDTDRYVLFSFNAIFQIKKIQQLNERLWQVNLILAKDDDEKLKSINKWIEKEFNQLNGFLRLGQMMINIDKRDRAKEFYEMLLESTPEDDIEMFAYIHRKLGYINDQNNELNIALSHYEKSYEIRSKNIQANDPRFCKIYAGMGAIERKQGHFEKAIEHFQLTLDIYKHSSKPNPSLMAFCLFNIGLIFCEQNKYDEARDKLEKALRYQKDSSSHNYDLLAKIHSNLSIVFEHLTDYKHAIEHAQKALEIVTNIIEPNHNQIGIYQDHLNKLYQKIDE